MLKLHCNDVDICRVGKILGRYSLKASITRQLVVVEGNVEDEALDDLLSGINVDVVENFAEVLDNNVITIENEFENVHENESNIITIEEDDDVSENYDTNNEENFESLTNIVCEDEKYDLIYSKVKRGEVYLCDFGSYYGSEQGGIRPAIVIQNDVGNNESPTTIVVPCTTKHKSDYLPVHYNFKFSEKTAVKFNKRFLGKKENTVLTEQVRVIDKTRLRELLGILRPEFMDELTEMIDVSLGLSHSNNTNEKEIVYVDKPVYHEKVVYKDKIVYRDKPVYKDRVVMKEAKREKRDINMIQMQLLSKVNLNDLLAIKDSNISDEEKTKKIIKLFGFDFRRKATEYLIKAIISAPKDDYFNLETLAELVAETEIGVDKEKVKKSMVAVVKETFRMKKVPAIDFIRLVNSFLNKWEEEQDD